MTRPFPAIVAVSVLGAMVLSGCAARRPVLYPNERVQTAGAAEIEEAIAECERLGAQYESSASDAAQEAATSSATGAAVGAATGAASGAAYGGRAGRGAAAGAAGGATAGLLRGIFRRREPSPIFKNFMARCLSERGYQVIGWQ